ncbi:MAG: hypothetical protein N3D18_11445 [Roseococcus sp.]|nr:hypothetical protein [Roseococcus sp.]
MRIAAFGLLLALAACAGGALPPSASLPPGMVAGATDPWRFAVLGSAHAYGRGAPPAGAEAARAAMLVEYLAASLPWEARWRAFAPPVGPALLAARAELREALAIAPEAPPQMVVNGLALARARLAGEGDVPPLPAAAFPAPETTLQRLAAPPPLPRTRSATAMVEREMLRLDEERLHQSIGHGSANGRH